MPRPSAGFTLIELLIVLLIIGVLASIAIPRFSNAKIKANVTVMKSDLRNLVTAEESYLAEAGTYYNGPVPASGTPFQASPGVTITLSDVTSAGWAATATHAAVAGWTCAVFMGAAAPVAPASNEGIISCQ